MEKIIPKTPRPDVYSYIYIWILKCVRAVFTPRIASYIIYIYMHYGLIFVCDMHHKFHQIIVNS